MGLTSTISAVLALYLGVSMLLAGQAQPTDRWTPTVCAIIEKRGRGREQA